MLTPLPFAILAVLVVAVLRKGMGQGATAFVLFSNWVMATFIVELTGEAYPVWFLAPLDYLSAIILFTFRRSHWQSVIMGIYAAQLVCHAAFIYSGGGVAATYYGYWMLTYLAWLQIALVGGWIIHELAVAWLSVFSRRRASQGSERYSIIDQGETL